MTIPQDVRRQMRNDLRGLKKASPWIIGMSLFVYFIFLHPMVGVSIMVGIGQIALALVYLVLFLGLWAFLHGLRKGPTYTYAPSQHLHLHHSDVYDEEMSRSSDLIRSPR
jgi:hypothetical protein